jgi:hypothetical protein
MPRSKTETTVNRLLKGGTAVCVAGIGYLVYREFLGYEGSGERIVLGVVLGILALLMSIALRMRVDQKINVLLVTGASVTALYIAEISLLLFTTITPVDWMHIPGNTRGSLDIMRRAKAAEKAGVDFDRRTRIEVIHDLEATGVDAVPDIPPSIVLEPSENGSYKSALTLEGREFLPLGSISNRVTVHCNESGEYTIYKSGDRGFNNPKGHWALKPIDVALLGDSFTLGACVPTGKSFAALVADAYPATLNLAADNNGPLLELATLREYLKDLRPRIVVWVYYEGNDLHNLYSEWKSPLLRSYLNREFRQGLAERQHDIDSELLAFVQEARDTSRWMQRLGQARDAVRLLNLRALVASALRTQKEDAEDWQHQIGNLRTVLSKAVRSVESWGGSLYFVYLPTWKRYAHPELAPNERDTVLATAKELGIHVIDIHRAFAREPDPLAFFPHDQAGHYNEKGHGLVANEIIDGIAKSQSKSRGPRHARLTSPVRH